MCLEHLCLQTLVSINSLYSKLSKTLIYDSTNKIDVSQLSSEQKNKLPRIDTRSHHQQLSSTLLYYLEFLQYENRPEHQRQLNKGRWFLAPLLVL